MLPLYACFGGLLTLLVLAALTDLRERRIPNWLTASTAALYPVYLVLSPVPTGWLGALGLALLIGVIGLALFARQLIGGGDVKLIAAISLWAGLEHFAVFALVTTLTGGAMALATLWLQRWNPLIQAHLAGFGVAAGGRHESATRADPPSAGEPGSARPVPATLPYGIAIAVGGVAVVIELMKS
jgi:Flp pilus assembly protein protease CpaA